MANTVFKAENGLLVQGNANVSGTLGVGGDVNISGNLVYTGTTTGDFIPSTNGYALGNTSRVWSLFANNITAVGNASVTGLFTVTGNATFSSSRVIPNANNIKLGDVDNRWDFYANNANLLSQWITTGTISSLTVSSNTVATGTVVIRSAGAGNATFNALTGVANSTDFITSAAAHGFANGDVVRYVVSAGNTALSALVNNSIYYVVSANTTAFKLATAAGGTALDLTAGISEAGHTLVPQSIVTLSSSGANISIGSDTTTFNGNSNFDSGVLFVDSVNNRVGVANTTPTVPLTVSGAASVSGDLTVGGNFTVSGTTTYVNTTNLNIGDNIITLNADLLSNAAPTENAGFEINRGNSANVAVRWNETDDVWELTENGTNYYRIVNRNQTANATTAGIIQVVDSTSNTSATIAAALNSVKSAYDNGTSSAANAYSNATTYASNASNITTGTLATAQLPATANIATAINVGNSTVYVAILNSSIKLGNSTVNTAISAGSITINGTTTTAYSSNADNLSSGTVASDRLPQANASVFGVVKFLDSTSNSSITTYVPTMNAVKAAYDNGTTRANTAYTDATTYASNASNITTGTLATAQLPATANIATAINVGNSTVYSTIQNSSITLGNSTVNTAISAGSITINGTSTTAYASNADNLTSGTVAADRLPAATTADQGAVKFLDSYANSSTTTYVPTMAAVKAAYDNGSNAYTNATLYSSNASNITSGTLASARLPDASTAAKGAVTFLDSYANTSTTTYVPTMAAVKAAYDNGSNAYTNATSYAASVAATAYSNATSYAASIIPGSGTNLQLASLGCGTAAPGSGAIRATGDITAYYSDGRLKEILRYIENGLDKVDSLDPVIYKDNALCKTFNFGNDDVKVGLIAQQVQAVLPEAVKPAPFDVDENNNSISGENYLTIQYEKVVPLLVAAIKELKKEIETLKAQQNGTES